MSEQKLEPKPVKKSQPREWRLTEPDPTEELPVLIVYMQADDDLPEVEN